MKEEGVKVEGVKEKLQPYQQEVRKMLFVDPRVKELLTDEQLKMLQIMGLQFGQPPEGKKTFYICSPTRTKSEDRSISEAMAQEHHDFFYYTFEMTVKVLEKEGGIISDLRDTILAMERGWLDSPYYR